MWQSALILFNTFDFLCKEFLIPDKENKCRPDFARIVCFAFIMVSQQFDNRFLIKKFSCIVISKKCL